MKTILTIFLSGMIFGFIFGFVSGMAFDRYKVAQELKGLTIIDMKDKTIMQRAYIERGL